MMLWQAAKRILERHRVHLRQGDLPACEFCGAPWPCEPSEVAQRALVVAGPALGRPGTVWIYVSSDDQEIANASD